MLNAGVPLPKIAEVVGWSQSTTVAMAKRYGHFNLESLRDAVAAISPKYRVFGGESPENPPQFEAGETESVN